MSSLTAKAAPVAALTGAALVLVYTALISSADGITKMLSGGYAAPQLYAISGGLVAFFCFVANRVKPATGGLSTTQPVAMAVRAVASACGSGASERPSSTLPYEPLASAHGRSRRTAPNRAEMRSL